MPPAGSPARLRLACLVLGALALAGCTRLPPERALVVDLDSRSASEARLLVFDAPGRPANVLRQPVPTGPAHLRFALPSTTPAALHFSPLTGPGEVVITSMRVVDPGGKEVARLQPGSLLPVDHVQSMTREGGAARIVAAGGVPTLFITVPCTEGSSAAGGIAWVTPRSLAIVALFVLAVCGLAISFVVFDALGGRRLRDLASTSAVLVGVFLTIAGARAWLVSTYGSPIPFLDQWWAEAYGLYIPMHDGCLAWRQLFVPHNEHRIFCTRLLNLALLLLNHQWDGFLQMVVNAALLGGVGVVLTTVMWLAGRRHDLDGIALFVGLVFGFPWGWENALTGFGSQFYFLALFAIPAVWLMVAHRPLSMPWVAGWALGMGSLVTVAAGVLTSVAIGTAAIVGLLIAPNRRREALCTLLAAAVIGALGWWLAVRPLEYHANLRAANLVEFASAFGRNLAWPAVGAPVLAPLAWLPMVWLAVSCVRQPRSAGVPEQVLLGLGAWVFVNAALLAYARGMNGQPPPYRYHELLGIGVVLNAVALGSAARRAHGSSSRRLAIAIGCAWYVAFVAGAASLSSRAVLEGARVHDGWHREWEPNVRNFVLTDDLPAFLPKAPMSEIPYNDASMLANAWLRHPYIRGILPAVVREPLRVNPDTSPQQGFVTAGYPAQVEHDLVRPGIGSFSSAGAAGVGEFQSAPMSCELGGSLKFQIAGFPGGPGLTLSVRDVDTGWEQPLFGAAGTRWAAFNVRCPGHAFTIGARDASADPHGWLAFRAPVELGRLSRWAERVLTHSLEVLFVGLVMTVLGLRAYWTGRTSCPA